MFYLNSSRFFLFYFVSEIVNTAIGEVTKVPETNKNVLHGAHSAGVSATSGSVIDEIEGWGDLWKLKSEGLICHVRLKIEFNHEYFILLSGILLSFLHKVRCTLLIICPSILFFFSSNLDLIILLLFVHVLFLHFSFLIPLPPSPSLPHLFSFLQWAVQRT